MNSSVLIESLREILAREPLNGRLIREAWSVASRGDGAVLAYLWDHLRAKGWTMVAQPMKADGFCTRVVRGSRHRMTWRMSTTAYESMYNRGLSEGARASIARSVDGHLRLVLDHDGEWIVEDVFHTYDRASFQLRSDDPDGGMTLDEYNEMFGDRKG